MSGHIPDTKNRPHRREERPKRKPSLDECCRYEAWDRFGAIVPDSQVEDDLHFMLGRRGFGCKLTNIELPPRH